MVRVCTITAALVLNPVLGAQASWHALSDAQPAGRRLHAIAYDEARERLVLFGGDTPHVAFAQNDTWEWDGDRWHAMASPQSPTKRSNAAMAYDRARGHTVLFGGTVRDFHPRVVGDTWRWDGEQWTEVTRLGPRPREKATMVYDSVRQCVVLFGGNLFPDSGPVGLSEELWEFDGTAWTQRFFSPGPGPMDDHVAAYDEQRQRMVVYSPDDHETWEWDGTAWTLADPNPPFPARSSASLAYDRDRERCVLYGGAVDPNLTPSLQDTWEWDGTSWTQVITPVSAGPRADARAVFDSSRSQVLVVGGRAPQFHEPTSAISAFDGLSWDTLTSLRSFVHVDAGIAWDGNTGRPMAHGGGGSQETYTFDGRQWVLMPVANKPPPRNGHRLQWDRARKEVVMFGGGTLRPFTPVDETWVWDGADWRQRHPANSPPPRNRTVMAYDERRERIVLYGGRRFFVGPPLGDTWIWDGENWHEIATVNSPPPLVDAAMAYDSLRDRFVLFGGDNNSVGPSGIVWNETWEFDGNDWAEIFPEHRPSRRTKHTMVYDPVRERVVLFGGENQFGSDNTADTWEWDGQDWVEVPDNRPPYFARTVFDEREARTFGFADGLESWEYRTDHPPALAEIGSACGQAMLSVAPLQYPVMGRELTLTVSPVRRFWPVLYLFGSSARHPIPLDFLGMPGCRLLLWPRLLTFDLADLQGTSSLRLPAFTHPSMLGVPFHVQAIARDPRMSQHRWVTTQALMLQYGR